MRFLLPWLLTGALWGGELKMLSVEKIWDQGEHNAFTDLIRFRNQWFCSFRESAGHVGGDGKLRLIVSKDGKKWESAALIEEAGIDLRDPKLSVTPDNRLMIVAGGSIYKGTKTLQGRQPRVMFSKDGRSWSAPQKVLTPGEWLWRVTWNKGKAYGVSYNAMDTPDWTVAFVESKDGVDWKVVKQLNAPGKPNETTVRFLADDTAVALIRRETQDKQAWIATSKPPYQDWKYQPAGAQFGGPNFIVLPGGRMIAGGRDYRGTPKHVTAIGPMTLEGYKHELQFPSAGDNSYPGFVMQKDVLWMSYYSSHEGKTSIYLAKIKVQ